MSRWLLASWSSSVVVRRSSDAAVSFRSRETPPTDSTRSSCSVLICSAIEGLDAGREVLFQVARVLENAFLETREAALELADLVAEENVADLVDAGAGRVGRGSFGGLVSGGWNHGGIPPSAEGEG